MEKAIRGWRNNKGIAIALIAFGSLATLFFSSCFVMSWAHQHYVMRSMTAEAFTMADSYKDQVESIYFKTGVCPRNDTNGLPKSAAISGNFVLQVSIGPYTGVDPNGLCDITATYRSGFKDNDWADKISGRTVTMTMVKKEERFAWACYANIPQKYTPRSCENKFEQ